MYGPPTQSVQSRHSRPTCGLVHRHGDITDRERPIAPGVSFAASLVCAIESCARAFFYVETRTLSITQIVRRLLRSHPGSQCGATPNSSLERALRTAPATMLSISGLAFKGCDSVATSYLIRQAQLSDLDHASSLVRAIGGRRLRSVEPLSKLRMHTERSFISHVARWPNQQCS